MDGQDGAALEFAGVFLEEVEGLIAWIANGDHHAAAFLELFG